MSELNQVISSAVAFSPMAYEHQIPMPIVNWDLLLDIQLSLLGQASAFPTGSVQDVHIYLNGNDITPDFISELRSLLDSANQVQLAAEYKTALKQWLQLESALGPLLYGAPIEKETHRAELLWSTTPVSSSFQKIGDNRILGADEYTFGWSGNLHLINFLYRQVHIPPVSITNVLVRYTNRTGTALSFDTISPAVLTLSSGPCRLFGATWQPSNPPPKGSLGYRIELVYSNPLEPSIQQIYDLVNAQGPIQREIDKTQTQLSMMSTQGEMENAQTKMDIAALQASLNEIKQKLGIP